MFKFNNKILLITFLVALSGCTTTSNTSSNTSITKKDTLALSTPRYGHATVNDGKHIYVFGGQAQKGFTTDIEIINPQTKESTVIKNKAIPRRYFSAVWDGKQSVYILGGVSLQHRQWRPEMRVEVFDTVTHKIKILPKQMSFSPRRASSVYYKNHIFVFGGTYTKNGRNTGTEIVSVYNIKNNSWHRMADMPTAKSTQAFEKDGFLYVVGGFNGIKALQTFERFNPKTNTWESLPQLPQQLSSHSLAIINDKLHTFGDYKEKELTYTYDFKTQTWEKTNIGYKASRNNASTTIGNTVYVTGGNLSTVARGLDYIQVFKF